MHVCYAASVFTALGIEQAPGAFLIAQVLIDNLLTVQGCFKVCNEAACHHLFIKLLLEPVTTASS